MAAAAIRETHEETGFEVSLTGLHGVCSGPEDRIVTYDDNGGVRHLVDIVLTARIVAEQLACGPESIRMHFFPKNCLLALETVAPPARQAIRDYLDGAKAAIL